MIKTNQMSTSKASVIGETDLEGMNRNLRNIETGFWGINNYSRLFNTPNELNMLALYKNKLLQLWFVGTLGS